MLALTKRARVNTCTYVHIQGCPWGEWPSEVCNDLVNLQQVEERDWVSVFPTLSKCNDFEVYANHPVAVGLLDQRDVLRLTL